MPPKRKVPVICPRCKRVKETSHKCRKCFGCKEVYEFGHRCKKEKTPPPLPACASKFAPKKKRAVLLTLSKDLENPEAIDAKAMLPKRTRSSAADTSHEEPVASTSRGPSTSGGPSTSRVKDMKPTSTSRWRKKTEYMFKQYKEEVRHHTVLPC